ncbi:Glutamyl-tRNA(Gln) amidotransferase subunit B, mitochondrial [Trichophyton interdigitale]|uniref:Glutamyl-tRNA(Gln) amidotransferase subunit B, mitochondrial n=1 Tax=Trichophyton interdigitale TaxID=101480 RepID=A0A9P5CWL9_9EURO|nr:Glutamyl-tRNA(Gln) amidotransferase subunit B, mitochondrial [Trichophyton interdigitale]KAF3900566.1 Glutamyl-tRNA(Gln) amidotransferase subunit B, mitochondrial [Trichophyton interdigitale]KAG8210278.1 Glutamyl-tRNA(Gln) amidotransferase subunit B, mitochondrial [Trichophyton interdigitale]
MQTQSQMVRLRLLHPRLSLSSAAVAARYWTPNRRLLSTQHVQSATSSIAGDAKPFVPLRKQLKDETKAKRLQGKGKKKSRGASSQVEGWELTVGIEVHAQLDTDSKLFSRASAAQEDAPNANVALFDLAFPGSQPAFQTATLIPALRAAIAFGCEIQSVSHFDRKHYFYQDQPAGYQITQYYEPYAKTGTLWLYPHDGIAPEDGEAVRVGIKQIQMEQDTAKSQELPSHAVLLDFNRVSRPLIEIITLPEIHSPATAAACVRKIQAILQSCGAVNTGMEMGGLRADVNVSVRRTGDTNTAELGQRTEIKNLSSFKAVEDAIVAERDRQIAVLEGGGKIDGETRGWTIGSTETRRLREKEGSVDYRYMPDPDIAPVVVGEHLVETLRTSMPPSPDELLRMLTEEPQYMLTMEDAKPLVELDDCARLEYYLDAVDELHLLQKADVDNNNNNNSAKSTATGKTVGNWVLHELGGLFSRADASWDSERVPAASLAAIVHLVGTRQITGSTAKTLLATVFAGEHGGRTVQQMVEQDGLLLRPLSQEEYLAMARTVMAQHPQMVEQIRQGQQGKVGFFVGQIKRMGEQGRVEAQRAEQAVLSLL